MIYRKEIPIQSTTISFNLMRNGKIKKRVSFTVFHNMKDEEINFAIDAWQARTDRYTCYSFCKYVNSKNEMTGFIAYPTQDDFEEVASVAINEGLVM